MGAAVFFWFVLLREDEIDQIVVVRFRVGNEWASFTGRSISSKHALWVRPTSVRIRGFAVAICGGVCKLASWLPLNVSGVQGFSC